MRNTVSCGIRTRQQIEDLGPSCVGAIPAVRGRPQALVWEVCKAPYSLFADRLRDLKVELDLVRNEAPLCVGIAPILEGVGSSTVAANVAHLFSLAGTRCVLVDGDLRRYELTARLMQDHVGDGLAAVLRSEATREVEVVLDHSNLAFIPAGTNSAIANSSDLLGSAGMRELLGGLRKRFVITLIDLPAVVEVSDAKAISPYLDGILLVIEYDRTCADTAGQQLRALENAGARVLGLVLNKADARSDKLR
jgi:succinoglycan biosynthesis transport protein ExoP